MDTILLDKDTIKQMIYWLSEFIRNTYNDEDAMKVSNLRTILEDKLL